MQCKAAEFSKMHLSLVHFVCCISALYASSCQYTRSKLYQSLPIFLMSFSPCKYNNQYTSLIKETKNISRSFHVLSEDSKDFFEGGSVKLWKKILVQETIMQLINGSFCVHEVKFYANNHKVLCCISYLICVIANFSGDTVM